MTSSEKKNLCNFTSDKHADTVIEIGCEYRHKICISCLQNNNFSTTAASSWKDYCLLCKTEKLKTLDGDAEIAFAHDSILGIIDSVMAKNGIQRSRPHETSENLEKRLRNGRSELRNKKSGKKNIFNSLF